MTKSYIQDIKNYYYDRLPQLSVNHQFHFASRIASWSGEQRAKDILEALTDSFVIPPNDLTQKQYLAALIAAPQTGRRVAHELRIPYFEKYPELFGLERAIFRVRHLLTVYGIDIRNDFLLVYPKKRLQIMVNKLAGDDQGLRILSSFAVNTIILSEILFDVSVETATPEFWYTVGLTYNLDQKESVQLLNYLYTHCIIAASNFYTRDVPQNGIKAYTAMIQRLEKVIDTGFGRISLDNKLEFLVAAKMIGLTSRLAGRIYAEASQSISEDGLYIIEKHNENLRLDRQTFEKAEHRNVLLIMSDSAYVRYKTR